ncbi:MAG: hypothetical protein KJ583_05130 [Nanoarchaeota archaeon]|nr:hypothetical protein [Nanoarchaeota archaeon]MBU1270357.1 hypothetical protein [Nanoarchaeota archaeon]MBU1604672.1 hypothetical protein [Nanoarchaeota archaeon]
MKWLLEGIWLLGRLNNNFNANGNNNVDNNNGRLVGIDLLFTGTLKILVEPNLYVGRDMASMQDFGSNIG